MLDGLLRKTLDDYELLSEEELIQKIKAAKERFGDRLIILGHHYQRPAICKLSDFVGDSFGLSQNAASCEKADTIVFAGVRFMAESAAILCRDHQRVVHPDPEAGCPMADMANIQQVEYAWAQLSELLDFQAQWTWDQKNDSSESKRAVENTPLKKQKIVPVSYMNSAADLKAFCGKHGGTICTSSNATRVFEWAYERGEKIFFFPDQHLGRNTAKKFGISEDEIVVWDPHAKLYEESGGIEDIERLEKARVILWRGHCPVHMKFTVKDIKYVRREFPGCKVVVHPECEQELVDAADAAGSTGFIVDYVEKAPSGSTIFIGTEQNLVQRLAMEYRDKKVYKLHRSLCPTMYMITLANMAYALDHLEEMDQVVLEASEKHYAKKSLDRMLQLIG